MPARDRKHETQIPMEPEKKTLKSKALNTRYREHETHFPVEPVSKCYGWPGSDYDDLSVSVRVCVCVRARVVCVCVCVRARTW